MAILKFRKSLVLIFMLTFLCCTAPTAIAQDTLNQGNDFQREFAKCMEGDEGYHPDWMNTALENLGGVGEGVANADRRFYCLDQAMTHHPGDAIVAGLSNAASEFWGDPIGDFVKAVMEGNSQALQTVMTLWTDYRLGKESVDSNVQGVKNIVFSLTAFALIASLVIGGGRIASTRRMGLSDGLEETGEVIAKFLISAFLIPPMVAGAVVASDTLSDWIMQSFGATSSEQLFQAAALDESLMGPVLMLVLVGIALAGSAAQIVALAFRTLLLPIAAGLLPIFAASSYSEIGRAGLNHLISLIVASIIFKPVSALLYCVVFWIGAQPGDDRLVTTIINVIMVGAAGFCGPALVRALVPAVAQAGGGSAGAMLAGGAAFAGGALGMMVGASSSSAKPGKTPPGKSVGEAGSAPQPGGGGGSGGGSGGGAEVGPRNGATSAVSSGEAQPSGAVASTATSNETQPSGVAVSSGEAQPSGAQEAEPNQQGGPRGQNRARFSTKAMRGGAAVMRSTEGAARRVEAILDENLGSPSSYHGQQQVRR